jgi:hypothetical protein
MFAKNHENKESSLLEDKLLLSFADIRQFIKDYLKDHEASLKQVSPPLDSRWFLYQTYLDYLESIPYLRDWAHDTFVLFLVMQVLPQTVMKKEECYQSQKKKPVVTIVDLYDTFIANWISVQAEKLIWLEIPLIAGYEKKTLAFAKALAIKMDRHKLTSIRYVPSAAREEDEMTSSEWDVFFSDVPVANDKGNPVLLDWRKLCCQLCPIIQTENYHYTFLHATVLNYLVSHEVFYATKLPGQSLNTAWLDKSFNKNAEKISTNSKHSLFAVSQTKKKTVSLPQNVSVLERIVAYEAAHPNNSADEEESKNRHKKK